MSGFIMPGRHVVIHADGACRGNPGPGGWAAVLLFCDGDQFIKKKRRIGGKRSTTNNQMEITAAIKPLRKLTRKSTPVIIVSDSQLLIRGMSEWLPNWKSRGWKTAKGKPVKNVELWQELDAVAGEFEHLRWEWVRGHSGNSLNEEADRLAQEKAASLASGIHGDRP